MQLFMWALLKKNVLSSIKEIGISIKGIHFKKLKKLLGDMVGKTGV